MSKGPLKPDFLDIYLTAFFRVRKFQKTSAMSVIFFLKMSRIDSRFWKLKKKIKKNVFFWGSFLWRCSYKLSLIRREYLSLAVNGLTNSPKTLHRTQRDFFQLSYVFMINKYGKGAVVQILTLFRPVYHVTCRRVLWSGTF